MDPGFWAGRTVLITGHTGFKGSWLTLWLHLLGASVVGVSRGVPTTPSLVALARLDELVEQVDADVRSYEAVQGAFERFSPSVVLHLAAQPLVRRSYEDPRGTFEANVMGVVNVLEAARQAGRGGAGVKVPWDKCYDNRGGEGGYREVEPMGGSDPYSASKGASE